MPCSESLCLKDPHFRVREYRMYLEIKKVKTNLFWEIKSHVPYFGEAGEEPEEACSRARMTAAALKRSSTDCAAALSAAVKGSSHSAGGQ